MLCLLLAACASDPAPVDTAAPDESPVETTTDSAPTGETAVETGGDSVVETGPGPDGCADGVDNDGDLWTDGSDPDCGVGDAEVGWGTTGCNDGRDNDVDGDVDGFDDDCDAAGDEEGDPGLVEEVPLAAADLLLRGTGADDGFGGRVGVAPDLDGDGVPEVLGTVSAGGAAELRWFSGALTGEWTADAATGTVGSTGDAPLGAFLADDVDGDGRSDLLVGSPEGDGAVYVYLGPLAAGRIDLEDAAGTLAGMSDASVGSSLAWVDDLSGDGSEDLLVGALNGGFYAGSVVPGPLAPGVTALSAMAQDIVYEEVGDAGGGGAMGAADFDGDGAADLVVGAPGGDDVHADHGKVYVLPGPVPAGTIELHLAQGTWIGEDAHHAVGREVLSSGDVNGDGLPDLLVGMSGNDSFGTVVDRAYLLYDPVVRGDTSLVDASVVLEGDTMFDGVGHPLALPGDVDGDGRDDVLLSAASSDLVGRDAGLGYLFYGAIPPGTYACARARATFIPEGPDGMAGSSLAGGDVNLDGLADLVLSAPGWGQGAIYVFWGQGR